MSKQISIDKLNEHLFESIEMLKNSKDPGADECEKMDVDTAKAIADLGKVVIEGYKVKAQVLNMVRNAENPNALRATISNSGIITDEKLLIAE
ncbi:MAG: hypothetical protein EOM03_13495 [Clostridia bacterium]|nr:hypothetical protein [Clostridia bacterium]